MTARLAHSSRSARRALVVAAALSVWALPARAGDGPPALAGTWARLEVTTEVSQIPMVGEVTTTHRAIALLEIAQDGDTLTQTETLCAIRFESDKSEARTSIGPGFVAHTPKLVRTARLVRRGAKWQYVAPEQVAVHGAELADPWKDALPAEPKDARVRDVDADGHPGLTVEIRGLIDGAIRLVQRVRWSLRGLVPSNDRVDGLVSWTREQSILDATNLFLKTSPPSRPHADRAKSWFRSQRVEAGADCAAILEDAERLFAR